MTKDQIEVIIAKHEAGEKIELRELLKFGRDDALKAAYAVVQAIRTVQELRLPLPNGGTVEIIYHGVNPGREDYAMLIDFWGACLKHFPEDAQKSRAGGGE